MNGRPNRVSRSSKTGLSTRRESGSPGRASLAWILWVSCVLMVIFLPTASSWQLLDHQVCDGFDIVPPNGPGFLVSPANFVGSGGDLFGSAIIGFNNGITNQFDLHTSGAIDAVVKNCGIYSLNQTVISTDFDFGMATETIVENDLLYNAVTDGFTGLNSMIALDATGVNPPVRTLISPVPARRTNILGRHAGGIWHVTSEGTNTLVGSTATLADPTSFTERSSFLGLSPVIAGQHPEGVGHHQSDCLCFANVLDPIVENRRWDIQTYRLPSFTPVDSETVVGPGNGLGVQNFPRAALSWDTMNDNDPSTNGCVFMVPDFINDAWKICVATVSLSCQLGPAQCDTAPTGSPRGDPETGVEGATVWSIGGVVGGTLTSRHNIGDYSSQPFGTWEINNMAEVTHVQGFPVSAGSEIQVVAEILLSTPRNSLASTVSRDESLLGLQFGPLDPQPGPAPVARVEFSTIEVPFFFHDFETGDFQFWSSVVGN